MPRTPNLERLGRHERRIHSGDWQLLRVIWIEYVGSVAVAQIQFYLVNQSVHLLGVVVLVVGIQDDFVDTINTLSKFPSLSISRVVHLSFIRDFDFDFDMNPSHNFR